jgi:hypothetical protein
MTWRSSVCRTIGEGDFSLALSGVTELATSTYDFFRLLGDMNGDGSVDSADFSIFVSNCQHSLPNSSLLH